MIIRGDMNFINKAKNLLIKITQHKVFWFIFCVIVIILLQIALHPRILQTSYIFAEDGKIFINQAQKYGLAAFSQTFAGYLTTMSRIFALVALSISKVFNNFLLVGETLEIMSMLFVAVIGAYFSSNEFKDIFKSSWLRLAIFCIIVIMMAEFSVTMYGGVGIHWWCCVLIVLASILIIKNKLPHWSMIPLIFISIVSSASCIIIAFPMIYYLWINMGKKVAPTKFFQNTTKTDIVKFCIIGIALLLQVIAMFSVRQSADVTLHYYKALIDHLLELILASPFFILGTNGFHELATNGLGIALGGTIWIIAFYIAQKKHLTKYLILFLVDVTFLYFIILYKSPSLDNLTISYNNLVNNWYWIFYNAIPSLIAVFSFILISSRYITSNKKLTPILLSGLALMTYTYCHNICTLDLSVNEDLITVNEHLDFSSNQYVKVKNTPYNQDWYLMVPVEPSYCEQRQCQNIWEVE